MPDLILARTSTEDDYTNITTLARRLDQWKKLDTDFPFPEAKATWERMSRTKAKRSFDEYKNIINTCQQKKFSLLIEILLKN